MKPKKYPSSEFRLAVLFKTIGLEVLCQCKGKHTHLEDSWVTRSQEALSWYTSLCIELTKFGSHTGIAQELWITSLRLPVGHKA